MSARAWHMMLIPAAAAVTMAAEYYVAADGTAGASGASGAPLPSITEALSSMEPGDVCRVEPGVYYETVKVGVDGVRLEANAAGPVIISAADPVTGWRRHDGHIWRAPVSWDLGPGENQLFIRGRWYPEARWPNIDDWDRLECTDRLTQRPNRCGDREAVSTTFYGERFGNGIMAPSFVRGWFDNLADAPHDGWPDTEGECRIGVKGYGKYLSSPTENPYNPIYGKPRDYWNGVVVWARSWWWSSNGLVKGSWDGVNDAGEAATFFELEADRMRWAGDFVFIGHYDFIDQPGEWVVRDGYLYLHMPEGVDAESGAIMLKRRHVALDIGGRTGVTVKGFHVIGGGVDTDSASACTIDQCHFYCLSHYWLSHWTDNRNRGNSGLLAQGRRGMLFSGTGNTLSNSSIYYSAANGVVLEGRNNAIVNNLFHAIDYCNTYASSVFGGPEGCVIDNNTFDKAGRAHLTSIGPCVVTRNRIADAMMMSGDGGALYTVGNGERPFEIAYNWFDGCYGEPSTYLYTDWGCAHGGLVHHNVFFPTISEGKFVPTAACGILVYNNTWLAPVNNRDWDFVTYDSVYVDSTVKQWANNLNAAYDRASWQFVDTMNDDYSLRESSPAVDAGVAIAGITDGFVGNAPDLGAYEYGAEPWAPGHTWGLPLIEEQLWAELEAAGSVRRAPLREPAAVPRIMIRPHAVRVAFSRAVEVEVALVNLQGHRVARERRRSVRRVHVSTDRIANGMYAVRVTYRDPADAHAPTSRHTARVYLVR